jgi:HSP20 family protein
MNAVAEKETQTVSPPPVTAEREFVVPQVNIVETKDGYVLEAEMPGVNKEGLGVNLEGNVLTLQGRPQWPVPQGNLVYRESRDAVFRRAFELGTEIDAARISARIEQGVLTVQLPKAEKVKPRKINVT